MKRIIACVLILCSLSILMLGCAKESDINVSLCEYPGLKWGMTMDEVKTALNIEEERINHEYTTEDRSYLSVNGLTLFGNPLKVTLFYFMPSETGVFGLSDIQAYFTEDTDMIKVRDTMIEIYGEGNTYGTTVHYLIDGEIVEEIWPGETSAEFHYYWPGSGKVKDVIPAGKMQEEIAHYASVFPEATMDTIEEWIGLRNLGLIGLVDRTVKEGYTPAKGYTGKCVKFYGSDICRLLLNYGE